MGNNTGGDLPNGVLEVEEAGLVSEEQEHVAHIFKSAKGRRYGRWRG